MFVENLTSSKGNPLANQFILKDDDGDTYFQSYATMIVKLAKDGSVMLDKDAWDYNNTSSKYRNIFLNETTKETKAKIESGEYALTYLN